MIRGILLSALLLSAAVAPFADEASLDAIASSFYPPDEPGAAVLVMKDGQVLLRKGYGLADLELGVPIEPDMVFRIGSVTKQITAAAILLLEQEGKLSVQDDVRKHLPDFPHRGRAITLEHLLTHTSGIRSYTHMEAFRSRSREDMTVDEVIALFRDEPLEFEPGEKYAYNNSGYFLLGAVIERVSGKSYDAFLRERIFEPLEMSRTDVESAAKVIPRRARGYARSGGEFTNAEYLSMTLPYAAGALVSTVDDLAKWDRALYTTDLLTRESLEKWWRPFRLANGQSTHYGYGWGISSYQGRAVMSHGGGINGYLCHLLRMPEERLLVAVLTNRSEEKSSPDLVARKLAAAAIGEPIPEPETLTLPAETLAGYQGLYRVDDEARYLVGLEEGGLTLRRFGDEHPEGGRVRNPGPSESLNRTPAKLLPVSRTDFVLEDSLVRARFQEGALLVSSWGREERAVRIEEPYDDASRVLGAIQKLFDSIRDRDEEAMRSVLAPDTTFVQSLSEGGRFSTRSLSVDEFVSRIVSGDGPPLREEIWSPEVRVSSGIASVWAPYAFWVGDRLVHCGEESFQLARTDRGWPGWNIIAILDTRRTSCEPPPN